ncbi:aa3-type cytochrome c oxidase subunit IV [Methylocella sp.]
MGHDVAEQNVHPDMDYAEHLRTYRLFLKLALYLTAGVAAILVLLALITL